MTAPSFSVTHTIFADPLAGGNGTDSCILLGANSLTDVPIVDLIQPHSPCCEIDLAFPKNVLFCFFAENT